MWAVACEQDDPVAPGGSRLVWTQLSTPRPASGEVLIRVAAAGVNRADLLQAAGRYPPPPGASEILGLECSGTIESVGEGVTGWAVGQRCCALLAGGGYAEFVACPAEQLLPIPEGVDLITAAALPEVACTVWSNLAMTAHLQPGESLLVHGGGSGIGTMAIQVAKAIGATVLTTASRDETLAQCAVLGADYVINYTADDFVAVTRAAVGGADVILDVVGAKYLARNVSALADGGRLVIIGMQGGTKAELDIAALLANRGTVAATALRSRPVRGTGSKAEVVAEVRRTLWPLIEAGEVRPVVEAVLPMPQARQAHRRLADGGHVGKILLQVPAATDEGAIAPPAATTEGVTTR